MVKKQPGIPVYVVRKEGGERVVHRNLLTQCMFLPGEQASAVTSEGVESDIIEDWEEDTEEIEGGDLPGTMKRLEHTGREELEVEAGHMSQGGEENIGQGG